MDVAENPLCQIGPSIIIYLGLNRRVQRSDKPSQDGTVLLYLDFYRTAELRVFPREQLATNTYVAVSEFIETNHYCQPPFPPNPLDSSIFFCPPPPR